MIDMSLVEIPRTPPPSVTSNPTSSLTLSTTNQSLTLSTTTTTLICPSNVNMGSEVATSEDNVQLVKISALATSNDVTSDDEQTSDRASSLGSSEQSTSPEPLITKDTYNSDNIIVNTVEIGSTRDLNQNDKKVISMKEIVLIKSNKTDKELDNSVTNSIDNSKHTKDDNVNKAAVAVCNNNNEIGVQVNTIQPRGTCKTRSNSTQSHGSTKQVIYGGKVAKKRKYKDAVAQTYRKEIYQNA